MLPAAIVFGFNFPLVVLLITRHQKGNAASVGSACAANTVGAILGAIAAGFWLVPLLGSFRLVTFTAAVNLALAAFLMARRVPRRRVALVGNAVLATVVAAGGWFGVLNDPASTTFNVIANRAYYPSSLLLDEITGTSDLVFAEDGLNASISVVRASEFLGLRTNGKVDASTHDTLTQLMVGHLGVLFHPAPKRVLIIGFGSGMTVSAVARYPGVERIDCVEIEPAVLRAASHLEPLNRGVLADPRVHVILNDARNFLMTAGGQYDVIISEPSNPWIAGVASLFTDEFYQQVTTRLAPGGILVQWVQAYSIFPDDLKMVLGTVARRFPQVTAWRGEWADLVLLAQSNRRPLSLDRLRQSWSVPALREDYAALGLNRPEGLLAYHLLDDPELRELSANARHNTDDLTRLEYRAPLALLAVLDRDNMEMFARQPSTLLPASIPVSDERSALIGTAETTAFLGGSKRDGALFSALSRYPASADGELVRAEWFVKTARPADARDAFSNARRLDPSSPKALVGLAELARAQKEYVTAEEMLREVLGEHPELVSALESYARLERDRKHPVEALAWQRKRVAADPGRGSDALVLLAVMALHAGDIRQAERAAVELLGRDPYNGNAQTMLGELFWRQSRWNEARVHLEAVVRYHPAWSAQNYILLANVYRNLDRMDDAEFTRRKGVRIFPDNARLARAVVPAVTP
jgi:spermidine synthase